ncbi:hypothetical protein TNCV_1606781 [Trichonephila clavipes]|nr:hypothetical protein TNCV_1606781 [Trichonephila clavipes]
MTLLDFLGREFLTNVTVRNKRRVVGEEIYNVEYRRRHLNFHNFSQLPSHIDGRTSSGRGNRVVKVSDRGLPGHGFEPSTTKDPPCRAAMHVKSVESAETSSR